MFRIICSFNLGKQRQLIMCINWLIVMCLTPTIGQYWMKIGPYIRAILDTYWANIKWYMGTGRVGILGKFTGQGMKADYMHLFVRTHPEKKQWKQIIQIRHWVFFSVFALQNHRLNVDLKFMDIIIYRKISTMIPGHPRWVHWLSVKGALGQYQGHILSVLG